MVCFTIFHEKNELIKNKNEESKIQELISFVKNLKTNQKIAIYSIYGHHLTLFHQKICKN